MKCTEYLYDVDMTVNIHSNYNSLPSQDCVIRIIHCKL